MPWKVKKNTGESIFFDFNLPFLFSFTYYRYSYELEVALKELESREEVLRNQIQKLNIEKEALQRVVDNVWKIDEEKEKYVFCQ